MYSYNFSFISNAGQKKHWKAKDGHRNRHNAFMKQKKRTKKKKMNKNNE